MKVSFFVFIIAVLFTAGCATPPLKEPLEDKTSSPVKGMDTMENSSVVAGILKNAKKFILEGKPEKAVIELENAARISPKRADIYLSLGEIRYKQKLCHQATGMARKAIQLGLKTRNLITARHIISGCLVR